MKELTKIQYIESVNNYEKLYLIINDDESVFLRADIENEETLRIEMMYFELNTAFSFSLATSECRGKYTGKIYFIEYDNDKDAEKNILEDFLNLNNDAIFLLCKDAELKNILPKYSNKSIYIVIK